MMLGPLPNVFLEESRLRIEPGEALILYTDGVTDANNPSGEFFGEDRLRRCVEEAADHTAQALCDDILAGVKQFQAGATQFDDIAVLVVSRNKAQPGSTSSP
jgi:sigma-B regulation protein RsbU (phosphoserine phosphatase)